MRQSDKSVPEADPFLPIGHTTSEVVHRGQLVWSLLENAGNVRPPGMADLRRRLFQVGPVADHALGTR